MKKKKLSIVFFIAITLGLLLGYLLFKNNSSDSHNHSEHSDDKEHQEEIWTCSMHPQIKKNEFGKCPICGMDLVKLESGETSQDNPLVIQMTKEAVELSKIQTITVKKDNKNSGFSEIRLNGKIKVDETKIASIASHIPGRIEKLFVSFIGEKITKGQKIAILYSPDLITSQKELLEAKKIQDISPSLLETAKKKLKYWKIPDDVVNQIVESEKIQENFPIYADYTGIIKDRKVSVGDHLNEGSVLFNIQNLDKLWVLFDVYEKDIPNVQLGNKISFETTSIPNKIFSAKITFIDPVINPNTRVATIRAEVNNTDEKLKPEMFVSGILKTNINKKEFITIPKTSVLWTGERSVVYIKVPDQKVPSFEYREVVLGESLGDRYVIEEGLNYGDEIVINGTFLIDASAQLNNKMSMINRDIKIEGENDAKDVDFTKNVPKKFKSQLTDVVKKYLLLKDELVKTDAENSIKIARSLKDDIDKVDMSLLRDNDAHMYWMEQLKKLKPHIENIINSNDIEEQRKNFKFISDELIISMKVFGIDQTFYVKYCSMAFDDEGGYWISDVEEIKNPYFGDKMLKCGIVKETVFSEK